MANDDSSLIKVGPAGSRNGTVWDQKGFNKLARIFISHSKIINSIQFQYADDQTVQLSERMGSDYGTNFSVVCLNHPIEYITWIRGRNNLNPGNVCWIKFGTNLGREYGPFGEFCSDDDEFDFSLFDLIQFGGFHGTADSSGLKSIGVYVKPSVTSIDNKSVVKSIFSVKSNSNVPKWSRSSC